MLAYGGANLAYVSVFPGERFRFILKCFWPSSGGSDFWFILAHFGLPLGGNDLGRFWLIVEFLRGIAFGLFCFILVLRRVPDFAMF